MLTHEEVSVTSVLGELGHRCNKGPSDIRATHGYCYQLRENEIESRVTTLLAFIFRLLCCCSPAPLEPPAMTLRKSG
jgi:hypothetical protein